jgi:hypothetical protein
MLVHTSISAVNCGHPQGATNVEDKYSLLCRLSNISGKILTHISVIAYSVFYHL